MKSRKMLAIVIAALLAGAAAYFGVSDAVDPFLEDLEAEPCDEAPAPDLGAGSSGSSGSSDSDGSSGSSGQ